MSENLFAKHKKSGWQAFARYAVKIRCHDLVGGRPLNADLIEKWVTATCKKANDKERQKIIDADVALLDETIDEVAEKQAIGFARIDGHLAIEGRQVKAMLKEAANIIKGIIPGGKDGKGIAALKSKVADQIFVEEEYIILDKTQPDDVEERPIHVMTRQGPRTSLKRCEIVRDVEIDFIVARRAGAGEGVPQKALLAILDYAQQVGLGADRSQGRGRFEVLNVEAI